MLKDIVENKSVTIFLKLNGNMCNMQCQYCYAHVNQNKASNKSFSLKYTIDYLLKYKNYSHVFVVFHGGEPLLTSKNNVSAILSAISNNFHNEWHVQFQTNATLLDEDWFSIFSQYGERLSVSISLDPIGEKDLRIANSFDYRSVVEKNILQCKKYVYNFGIISVAHRYNLDYFKEFIVELIKIGVPNLTINKYETNILEKDTAFISEQDYVDLLIEITSFWIKNKYYKNINIQPIQSLFLADGCKICRYLADKDKCTYFRTFYSIENNTMFCDHITDNIKPIVPNSCQTCDIYQQCGGGCLLEKKDKTFCSARHKLVEFIKAVRK